MKRKKNGISGDVTSFVTVFLSKIGQFAINVFPLLVARPQGQLATRWLWEETVVIDRRAITGSLPNLLIIWVFFFGICFAGRFRDILREHDHCPVRPASAGSVGSGPQVALHVARPVREVRHLPPVPRRHAGRRPGRLCRWQRRLLDADPSGQGPVGFRSLRIGQDRPDDDHGLGHQGRRQQIRHARPQLHGPRRQTGAHPAGRPARLRHTAQAHVAIHQNQEFRLLRIRPLLRPFPGRSILKTFFQKIIGFIFPALPFQKAFKFPDSMEVHFQCTIQICRNQCPDQCAGSDAAAPVQYAAAASAPEPRNPYARIGAAAKPRSEEDGIQRSPRSQRDVGEQPASEQQDVGINRIIQVVSTGDLTFALEQSSDNTTTIVFPSRSETEGLICMTSPGFAATLVVLLAILIISCLLSAFLCIRHRAFGVDRSLVSAFANPAFAHKKGHF